MIVLSLLPFTMFWYLQIQKALISVFIQNSKHGHMNFFLTMADTPTSQNIDLPSRITL